MNDHAIAQDGGFGDDCRVVDGRRLVVRRALVGDERVVDVEQVPGLRDVQPHPPVVDGADSSGVHELGEGIRQGLFPVAVRPSDRREDVGGKRVHARVDQVGFCECGNRVFLDADDVLAIEFHDAVPTWFVDSRYTHHNVTRSLVLFPDLRDEFRIDNSIAVQGDERLSDVGLGLEKRVTGA